MTETNHKDYKLRQLILNEWHANSDVTEATENIRAKLGEGAVTPKKVKNWYKRFGKGNTAMLSKNSKLYVSTQVNGQDVSNSLLLFTNKRDFSGEMLTNDGRFLIFDRGSSIVFFDLFQDSRKVVSLPGHFNRKTFMGGEHLISFEEGHGRKIHALKINFGDLTVSALRSVSVHAGDQFYCDGPLLDQSNKNRFLIVARRFWHDIPDEIATGQVIDGQIVLGEFSDLFPNDMKYKRLLGNNLQGFINDVSAELKFYELDLDTMKATTKDAPIVLGNDNSFEISRDCSFNRHSWAGDCFYGFLKDRSGKHFQLLAFNSKTKLWSNAKISAANPEHLFASSDGMITLNVSDKKSSIMYRFATKKPDSLKNLAWFTILRNSIVLGSEIYRLIAHRLPFTCDLRPLIPNNGQK